MPIIYGVDSLSDYSVDLLIGARARGSVGSSRELRKRIKEDLDAAVAYPTYGLSINSEDGKSLPKSSGFCTYKVSSKAVIAWI